MEETPEVINHVAAPVRPPRPSLLRWWWERFLNRWRQRRVDNVYRYVFKQAFAAVYGKDKTLINWYCQALAPLEKAREAYDNEYDEILRKRDA